MPKFSKGEVVIYIPNGAEVEILSGLYEDEATSIQTGKLSTYYGYDTTDPIPNALPGYTMFCRPEQLRKKHLPNPDIEETKARDKPIKFNDLITELNKQENMA